jgi:hypothetical protein
VQVEAGHESRHPERAQHSGLGPAQERPGGHGGGHRQHRLPAAEQQAGERAEQQDEQRDDRDG